MLDDAVFFFLNNKILYLKLKREREREREREKLINR
jgi:hypothetical protein